MLDWDNVAKQLPLRLKEAREERGLKQNKLAQLAQISPQAYGRYEETDPSKPQNRPRLETLIAIAKALQVSIDWLLDVPVRQGAGTAESLLVVLDNLKPEVKIGDGKNEPFLTLVFKEESPDNSGHEIRDFVSQYLLAMEFKEAGDKTNIDTTGTINVIQSHLLNRYKDLPKLPDYDFVIEQEKIQKNLFNLQQSDATDTEPKEDMSE